MCNLAPIHVHFKYIIIMIIYIESGSKCRAGLDGRVSHGKPLTSPVLQGPAKPGGQGTSKGSFEMHIQMDSVTLGLRLFAGTHFSDFFKINVLFIRNIENFNICKYNL